MNCRRIRLALVVAVGAVLLGAVSVVPILWPPTSDPRHADAVVVPSGDHGERLPRALDLIHRGAVAILVFVGEPDSAQELEMCRGGQAFEVVCLHPTPDSTRAEAEAVGREAARRGWRTIVVASTSLHVFRAGLLFSRCVHGTVLLVSAPPPYGWATSARQVLHEWLGLADAWVLKRGC